MSQTPLGYASPLSILALFLFSACSGPPPTPTPVPSPTPAPTATARPATAGPRPVTLPRDDAPHRAYTTEWWYYNGHLQAETGEQFSFHYVVFDVRFPGISPSNIYQVAITDHQRGAFAQDQRLISNAPVSQDPAGFQYANAGWLITGNNGSDHVASTLPGYAFELDLRQTKPAALHGGIGFLDFNATAKTYYYSRTRMAATGTVTTGVKTLKVTGMAWFDHQWGNFRPERGGWDWFALQLDDGTDLMLFQLRDATGALFHSYATMAAKDGSTQDLPASAVQITPADTWTSPASGGKYPMGWRLKIPGANIDVSLEPVVRAAEFDATSTTFNKYWEGPVTIRGNRAGKGFVEMVGYAPVTFPRNSPI